MYGYNLHKTIPYTKPFNTYVQHIKSVFKADINYAFVSQTILLTNLQLRKASRCIEYRLMHIILFTKGNKSWLLPELVALLRHLLLFRKKNVA